MQKQMIGKLISVINRQNQKFLTKELKRYNIGGGGQPSFLIEILLHPGITQDQLTNDLRFDKATTARAVKQLEAAGYIERKIDEDDRRSYHLYPTKKAVLFFPKLQSILQAANDRLTEGLTVKETEELLICLRKMVENEK